MTEAVYKVTGPNGEAHIADNGFSWPLPQGKRPGKWVHCEGKLQACKNGLHACRDILDIGSHMNLRGFTVWFAEGKGECLEGSQKTAFESLRLVRKSEWSKECAVLFAADCAERALTASKWENKRSWQAVAVARAVGALADSAARSAAYSADSADSAAYSAARSAADSAARSAAYSAARSADSAAYSADSAAYSAARSAADSADSAAYSARSAAYSAAYASEKDWQRARLLQYLEHGIDAHKLECEGWASARGLASEANI